MILNIKDSFYKAHQNGYICFDIIDYLNNDTVGSTNTEVPCDVWEDLRTTATGTLDAFNKATNEFFRTATGVDYSEPGLFNCLDEPCFTEINEAIIDYWGECYTNWLLDYNIFWNTMICTPITGESTVNVKFTDLNDNVTDNDVAIDYKDGVLTQAIWDQYKASTKDLMCCHKQLWNKITGDTFPSPITEPAEREQVTL